MIQDYRKGFVLLWLIINCIGCDGSPITRSPSASQPIANAETMTSVKTPTISLNRSGCWGPCPVYVLNIYSDGTVVFEGDKYVREKGVAKGKISQQQLKMLIAEFQAVDFLSLKDTEQYGEKCPPSGSDAGRVVISLSYNGEAKSLCHEYTYASTGTLAKLIALERLIDKVTNTEQWIK